VGKIYAGTSGWAYPSWKPDFYPAKLPSAKFLGHYAEKLNTVEVNYTFRRFPTEKLLRGWIAATPPEFQFGIKANQKITHVSRLRNVVDFTKDFLNALEPLATENKLGPVLFQLPPYLRADAGLLSEFLATLPRNVKSAFEFRHVSWFCEQIYALMREANVALCNAESEKLETPEVQTADFAYLRLRKETYLPAELQAIANTVSDLAKHGDAYVYFKHEETPEGALNALRLREATRTS
jgi:uncharacterized protein YecE (DUF72 family)